jgi:primase-polymerase (primpol)-like protein
MGADGGRAAVDDSTTWSGFRKAVSAFRSHTAFDGIGFVFSAADPYVGIDLDDCRDPATGDLEPWARTIIRQLDTYTEVSPSGTGIHCLCEGVIPGERRRRGDIELYDDDRYFTVTGRTLAPEWASDELARRPHEVERIYEQHIASRSESEEGKMESPTTSTGSGDQPPEPMAEDQELIRRAKQAANGGKFIRLWEGRWQGEYPSHSEADLALCDMLAFWTQKDRVRMDRLFRRSGLMRPKWDAQRGDQTYGELTLEKALTRIGDDEVYDPSYYS